jgi:hypothetical protein
LLSDIAYHLSAKRRRTTKEEGEKIVRLVKTLVE